MRFCPLPTPLVKAEIDRSESNYDHHNEHKNIEIKKNSFQNSPPQADFLGSGGRNVCNVLTLL
jgi:hypothetical protein